MGCEKIRSRTRAAISLIAVWAIVLTTGLVIPTRVTAQTAGDARTALLIANNNYVSFGGLANPVPEARALAGALRQIGFSVTVVENASRERMLDAVAQFEATLRTRGGIAFFHYGGHAVQVGGRNYLIPTDQDIPDERRVPTRAVDAQEIMAALDASGAQTNIVVLDSCRNNPLPASSGRSATRGLTRIEPPRNSIVVYSAESDSVAQDGVFTPALTRLITRPGLSLTDLLIEVRREVVERTNGTQRPGEYNQLMEQVYLAGPGGGASPAQSAPAAPSFGPVTVATGSLSISVTTSATVTLLGQSVQLPAGGTLPVDNVAVGTVPIQVRYANGQTESRSITVTAGQRAAASFSYRPPAPAPTPAPSPTPAPLVQPAAVPHQPVRESIPTVPVQGGTFQMGSAGGGDSDERPVHSVTVSSFRMARTETTVAQFRAFVNATGYRTTAETSGGGRVYTGGSWQTRADASWRNPYLQQTDTHPVVLVSWLDAVAYANWVSRQDGLEPVYTISGTIVNWNRNANGWRLPTEAEWEFAARGGTQSGNYTYAGGNDAGIIAWFWANSSSRTQPVAGKQANELGLQDMSGNVWEWCWDWYGAYPSSAQTDPAGPSSGSVRVLRGGSWNSNASHARSANRYSSTPGARIDDYGFRLVRSAVR